MRNILVNFVCIIIIIMQCIDSETVNSSSTVIVAGRLQKCYNIFVQYSPADSLLRQQYEEQAGKNTKLEEELNHLQQELAKQRGFRGGT